MSIVIFIFKCCLDLKFTRDLQDLTFGCPGEQKQLRCCATGYTSPITWEQKDAETGNWRAWDDVIISRQRCSHNQTFVIQSYDKKRDSGMYRCRATKVTEERVENIKHEINLTTASKVFSLYVPLGLKPWYSG